MAYRNDKVTDVIKVLTVIKNEFIRSPHYKNTSELRLQAVQMVAERELKLKRYKNMRSAFYTIHDACARRFKPDVENIQSFDRLIDEWLYRENASKLKNILTKNCQNKSQQYEVEEFFKK